MDQIKKSVPRDHTRATHESSVRKLATADAAAASRTLAAAFHDDPLLTWMTPDPRDRRRRLERIFALSLKRVWHRHDECYVTTGVDGVGVWMPPRTWRLGALSQLAMLPGALLALRADVRRMSKLDAFLEATHPDEPDHWYLAALGVTPARQNRGLGTELMRPMLARCDAARMPAYLETSTTGGRRLYERIGFEVVEECDFEGLPVWRMWRDPCVPSEPTSTPDDERKR